MSHWNGQAFSGQSQSYPQMGDMMQNRSGSYNSNTHQGWASALANACGIPSGPLPREHYATPPPTGALPMTTAMGGDYSNVCAPLACPLPGDFFGQGNQACIENGEAYCAYNGMDMAGAGGGAGHKGGFW